MFNHKRTRSIITQKLFFTSSDTRTNSSFSFHESRSMSRAFIKFTAVLLSWYRTGFITGFIGYRRAQHIVCRTLYRFPANIFLRVRASAKRAWKLKGAATPGRNIFSREFRVVTSDEADFVAGGNGCRG